MTQICEAKIVGMEQDVIKVETCRREACGVCKSKESCSAGAVVNAMSGKKQEFLIPRNNLSFEPYEGMSVLLEIDGKNVVFSAAIVYLVPLFSGVVALIFLALLKDDSGAALQASVFLGAIVLGFVLSRCLAGLIPEGAIKVKPLLVSRTAYES